MGLRRTLWLSVQVLCVVFYWAYREWLSWLLLMAAVWLPWLSLAVSLPAMLTAQMKIKAPRLAEMGSQAQARALGYGRLPLPRFRAKLLVRHGYTGEERALTDALPTDHCGCLQIRVKRVWLQDYMGLFRLPRRSPARGQVLVRPKPVPMENLPELKGYKIQSFRPKRGGGFSENHELRLYRPGDELRQIHWKLSAKTGKLLLREPIEPMRGLAVVSLTLSGTPEVLDRKLGQLLWVSRKLLLRQMPHRIHCATGRGVAAFSVSSEGELMAAMDALLVAPLAQAEQEAQYPNASWRCHIGGTDHG